MQFNYTVFAPFSLFKQEQKVLEFMLPISLYFPGVAVLFPIPDHCPCVVANKIKIPPNTSAFNERCSESQAVQGKDQGMVLAMASSQGFANQSECLLMFSHKGKTHTDAYFENLFIFPLVKPGFYCNTPKAL